MAETAILFKLKIIADRQRLLTCALYYFSAIPNVPVTGYG